MILESISFKNFKRYSDETINFSDGITGIIGNNGTGKSTIVQGILFALYGVRAGIEGEFISSQGAGDKEKCSVSLDFIKDGNSYNVTRWYRRTASTIQHDAQVKIGGKLLADGVSGVESEIERIIGMQASDFKNTIYAGQKDLSTLLDDSPAERQKWFMKMLGIDYLKREADAGLKIQIDDCKIKISGLERYLEEKEKENIPIQKETAEENLKEAENNLGEINKETAELERREEALKKTADELSAKWRDFRDAKQKIEILNGANSQKSGYIGNLKNKLENFEGILPEFERTKAAEEKYPETKKEYSGYLEKEKKHSEISSGIERLEYELKSENRRLDEINTRIKAIESDKKRLEQILPDLNKRKELLGIYEELKVSAKEFRELERESIRVSGILKHYTEQAAELRNEIEDADKRLNSIGYSEDLDRQIRRFEEDERKTSEELISFREAIKTIGKEKARLSKELEEICELGEDGKCPKCKRKLGEHYASLKGELTDEIESGELRCKDLKDSLGHSESKIRDLRSELERLRGIRKESDRIISLSESRKKERQELYIKVEGLLGEENLIKEEIDKIGFSEEKFAELEVAIKSLEPVYRESGILKERTSIEDEILSKRTGATDKISELIQRTESETQRLKELGFDQEECRRLAVLFEEAEILHQRYLELKPGVDQIPALRSEIRDLTSEMENNSSEMKRLESEMQSLGISEEMVKDALLELERSREELNKISIERAELDSRMRHLKEEAERLNRDLAGIEERKKKCEALVERQIVLEKTRSLVKDYILYLLNVVRSKIEGEVGRVLSEITDGRYQNVLIDENFDILVNDIGENFPARRFSGGEQDDIAIALRIALSRYLAEMHNISGGTFLIFDEIFGSQDEERRNNLIAALRTQEAHFPQIFLISHVNEIQGEFSTSLLVKMKDDWNSEVIEVS